jgi:NADPH:quinone reductase
MILTVSVVCAKSLAVRAIQIAKTGGPEVLAYVELPTPTPGPDEVLVRAHAIGVNMPEVLVRRGTYAWMPLDHDSGSRRGATAALLGMLSDGTIRPSIQERVPLAEAARAQALLESGRVLGKLVLKP